MEIWIGGCLALFSVQDIRYKKISFWMIIVGIVFGIIHSLSNQRGVHILLDVLPGCLLCILAQFGKKIIGMGDGLIGIFYGLFLGWEQTCFLLMFAFWLVSLIGLLLCMRNRKHSIKLPFVPFLTIVHVGMCL